MIIFIKIAKYFDLVKDNHMNLLEKVTNEIENPILSGADAYDWMEKVSKENGNNTGSWAIWNPDDIRDASYVSKNKHLCRPEFLVVGMNQSEPVPVDGIFHTEKASFNLAKVFMRGALKRYYGAYVTDLLNIYDMNTKKLIYEPDSEKVKEFFKDYDSNSEAIDYAKKMFLERFLALKEANGSSPLIIALGDNTFGFTKLWTKGHSVRIIQIYHPSKRGLTAKEYQAFAKQSLNMKLDKSDIEAIERVEKKSKDAGKKRSVTRAVRKPEDIEMIKKHIALYINQIENRINTINNNISNPSSGPGVVRHNKKLLVDVENTLNKARDEEAFIFSINDKLITYYKNYTGDKKPLSIEEVEMFNNIRNKYVKNAQLDQTPSGPILKMQENAGLKSLRVIIEELLK
jgi:hypothetical protein